MSDKYDLAIERLQMGAKMALEMYGEPLSIGYSGGKDSQVLIDLALKSGIDFQAHHNLTTVDAPDTIRAVRETFAMLEDKGIKATINHPPLTMWQLIVKNMTPPTRLIRYCCAELKERNVGGFIATGVRREESVKRRDRGTAVVMAKNKAERESLNDEVFLTNDNSEKRRMMERCIPKNTMCVNPIIDWSDAEVCDYYFNECDIHNPLYSEGFTRVGCVGCPMAPIKQVTREFAKYPMFKRAYIRAFDKMVQRRIESGLRLFDGWETGEGVYHWWIEDGVMPYQEAIDYDL